jgi:hypothetical protein
VVIDEWKKLRENIEVVSVVGSKQVSDIASNLSSSLLRERYKLLISNGVQQALINMNEEEKTNINLNGVSSSNKLRNIIYSYFNEIETQDYINNISEHKFNSDIQDSWDEQTRLDDNGNAGMIKNKTNKSKKTKKKKHKKEETQKRRNTKKKKHKKENTQKRRNTKTKKHKKEKTQKRKHTKKKKICNN